MNLLGKWIIGLLIVGLGVTMIIRSNTGPSTSLFPTGTQTFSGTLVPVPISLSRRGTHLLTQNGRSNYYVESAKANLRQFEGLDVTITGHIEKNTDPDALPVFVASGVTLFELALKTQSISGLSLALDVPETWQASIFSDGARFAKTGNTDVLLSVLETSLAALPDGENILLNGRRAVRTATDNQVVVYVEQGTRILALSVPAKNPDIQDQTFVRILHSLRFGGAAVSSVAGVSSAASSISSILGAPCGGAAGVLCPAGQYCEVTESDGVGRCRPL